MAASNRRRRALTYDDLPKDVKGVIKDYAAFTNASLRAAVKEYFEDKAATERRHGKIGTWDVGRVTDMSELFYRRWYFNEARAGVPSSRRGSPPRRASKYGFHRTLARGTRRHRRRVPRANVL